MTSPQPELEPEHVDVLIIGAGLSGIGAAAQLRRRLPGRSVAVLEGRSASGGTWDLFRYPGVRSDSDMFTLGYHWRPWRGDRALADGPAILQYVRDVAREYDVERLIRYDHRVTAASWDSATRPLDRRRRPRRHAAAADHELPVGLLGLLRLRPRLLAGLPRHRALRRPDRAPAALARGPRLRGQAGRGDRQRRHRGHPGAGDGRAGRARDDAAALPDVRPLAARARRPRPAPRAAAPEARPTRSCGGRTSSWRWPATS